MSILNYLLNIQVDFHLLPETFHLSVNILDRYLGIKSISKSNLLKTAVSSIFLASKIEEIYAPESRDFVYITDNRINKKMIFSTEYEIIKALDFNMLTSSSLLIFNRLFNIAFESKDNIKKNNSAYCFGCFILEALYFDIKSYKYSNSIKAFSALLISRKYLNIKPQLPNGIINNYFTRSNDLSIIKDCSNLIVKLIYRITSDTPKNPKSYFSALRDKYSTSENKQVYSNVIRHIVSNSSNSSNSNTSNSNNNQVIQNPPKKSN